MTTYKSALKDQALSGEDAKRDAEEADRLGWEAVKKKYQHAIHQWFPEGQA